MYNLVHARDPRMTDAMRGSEISRCAYLGSRTMTDHDNDALLTAMAEMRDHVAAEVLFSRYERMAYGLAYNLVRNPSLAEEAVQNAMVRIWRFAHT